MAKILRSMRELIYAAAIALCAAAFLLFPTQSVAAARDGLLLCGNVIIPSLFPFFVLSGFCVEIGLTRLIGRLLEPLMRPLFRVSGTCASAFVLGLIGGYPVGAKTAIALYEKKDISKDEAERLLGFCNNCGPAFIFGVVGAGLFSSSLIGLFLYCTHVLASILVGMLFRFRGTPYGGHSHTEPRVEAITFSSAFTGSIYSALQSTLNICAFVIFFTVFIRLLILSGVLGAVSSLLGTLLLPLGGSDASAEQLLIGAIEMSSGVSSLSSAAGNISSKLCMVAFVLGWAGLCVHCQVLSFLGSSGLSARTYLTGKLLHGVFSASLVGIFLRIFPLNVSVETLYAEQISSLAEINFSQAITASSITAGIIWLVFSVISLIILHKGSGNPHKNRV